MSNAAFERELDEASDHTSSASDYQSNTGSISTDKIHDNAEK